MGSLTKSALTVLFVLCAASDDLSMRSGLRGESTTSGLALIRARGASIVVIPFDGPEAYFASENGVEVAGFSNSGRLIAWAGDPIRGRNDFKISTISGNTIAEGRNPAEGVSPVALSEASARFTFSTSGSPADPAPSLNWISFDFSHGGLIDNSTGNNPQGDWSPDGRFVVYEKNGAICVFDALSGSHRELAKGHDPTWSLSGGGISFRAPDGRAALITTGGKPIDWPISKYRPLSAIRWSPDGKYVAFSEERTTHVPLIGAYYDLVICRVSDGQTISVREFGPGSPDLQGFYWIVDYRHFCTGCKRGAPFN
jgi:hypothetical protein